MPGLEAKSSIAPGGGPGVAAACARRLAADGATVTICGRTEDKLVKIADEIRSAGGKIQHVVTDVTVEDDVARLVASHVEAYGSLTGVVANAGGGGGIGPYHLQDTNEFIRVLHLNVLGTMLC